MKRENAVEVASRKYALAGIPVAVVFPTPLAERVAKVCAEYETDADPIVRLEITDADVDAEARRSEPGLDPATLALGAFHRKFATAAVDFDALVVHCSAISVDGTAVAFAALSGTGKSTHSRICREVFGERVRYVNDDKPFFRLIDGKWRVFGSPWRGKHRLGANVSAPLGDICLLRRGVENRIEAVAPTGTILRDLLTQVYRPDDPRQCKKALELALRLVASTPIWELRCDMSPDAARTSIGATRGTNERNEKRS